MKSLLIAQIVTSALLIIVILLQQRGTALGSSFGGGGEFYSTRRGIQKKLLWLTVLLGTAFLVLAILEVVY
ncbi:MAG: preprotein translocase subunit SecG [Candidatus Nealsonbacteria bacterium CG_4_8_14_3_um_filter_39_7]|uniref:Protein-export membrane protein SecG n=1 Tax=Candidatus Nealsonbacteria bacterium CG23_combo_of_CG06-09_8_20_14_all_39_17 TaxID=1974722 RepID=A0A2G9YUD0_9BACT|nr:MAG: preprotein translocase subunit SecG [Candidatus Nealsonbacteria bacterium CG23_combo_of_CG06-09_8_20_14_all_39_17]PIU43848.1 MAG: preprotein translocase subunit SecG [Candidatus Nealsonbacteria bacterium CG07_land_8_20_14_0_80_39_13]PIW91166.1 MAG: preprotein translocase subunit SecG [Candidatus Nealsonbacteria bacterium CG_4_8_14_3_um_filter_39_7]